MSNEPTHYVKPVYGSNDGYKPVAAGDVQPFSANTEAHKTTNPVRSITIEFERMPGIPHPVTLKFCYIDYSGVVGYNHKHGRMMIVFLNHRREPEHKAFCHPDDTFSWEIGMRLCVKRIGNPVLYRAFLRWMWLKKAAHECRKHIKPHGCDKCPNYDNDRSCRTLYQPHWWATPESIIAREFGRVEVRVE